MRKLLLLSAALALILAVTTTAAAQTVTVNNPYTDNGFSVSIERLDLGWYPVFRWTGAYDGNITIHYKTYSSAGKEIWSNGMETVSESWQRKVGTKGDKNPVRIQITHVSRTGGSSSGGGTGSTGRPYVPPPGDYPALAAVVLAATGVAYLGTDIYVGISPFRPMQTITAGLRNSINNHIDVELLANYREAGDEDQYNGAKYEYMGDFGVRLNTLFNVKQRWIGDRDEPIFNPYFGFTLVEIPTGAMGPIVGASIRAGRWKFHGRYSYLHDFVTGKPYGNFVEFGVSFTYKYQFSFR